RRRWACHLQFQDVAPHRDKCPHSVPLSPFQTCQILSVPLRTFSPTSHIVQEVTGDNQLARATLSASKAEVSETCCGPLLDDAADLPPGPAIVTVDGVRMVRIAPPIEVHADDMVTGDQQPPAFKLDAMAGPGGVPGPGRIFFTGIPA